MSMNKILFLLILIPLSLKAQEDSLNAKIEQVLATIKKQELCPISEKDSSQVVYDVSDAQPYLISDSKKLMLSEYIKAKINVSEVDTNYSFRIVYSISINCNGYIS